MNQEPLRILDVGCGTGASVIDLKRLFGDSVEVVGLDVVRLQVDLARQRLAEEHIDADIVWYDGEVFPFENASFDAVYTSDVLGHVPDVDVWLSEISRVLKPGGSLAMFSESAIGRHAWMRRWFVKHGVNTDPHAEFHISLHSKREIIDKIADVDINIQQIYSTVWAKFLVHPDELYPALQKQKKFHMIKKMNAWLYRLKKKTHPGYAAVAELYSLIEMLTIGRWIESQGYVILGRKKR